MYASAQAYATYHFLILNHIREFSVEHTCNLRDGADGLSPQFPAKYGNTGGRK